SSATPTRKASGKCAATTTTRTRGRKSATPTSRRGSGSALRPLQRVERAEERRARGVGEVERTGAVRLRQRTRCEQRLRVECVVGGDRTGPGRRADHEDRIGRRGLNRAGGLG